MTHERDDALLVRRFEPKLSALASHAGDLARRLAEAEGERDRLARDLAAAREQNDTYKRALSVVREWVTHESEAAFVIDRALSAPPAPTPDTTTNGGK